MSEIFSNLTIKTLKRRHWNQNNAWNLFKVNNKDTRMTSLTSYWCLYCYLWTNFTQCSGVSTVDFEQVNANWDVDNHLFKNNEKNLLCKKRSLLKTSPNTYSGLHIKKLEQSSKAYLQLGLPVSFLTVLLLLLWIPFNLIASCNFRVW